MMLAHKPLSAPICRLVFLAICTAAGFAPLHAQVSTSPVLGVPGEVRQVSSQQGIVAARLEASRAAQIGVAVKFLLVDNETRAKIYATLGSDAIKTSVTKVPTVPLETASLDAFPHVDSTQTIGTSSRVATSVLDAAKVTSIMKAIQESPQSKVGRTPSLIILEDRDAEYSDVAQRPFIVDFERVENTVKPILQVLDEGTLLRVNASLTDWVPDNPRRIRLKSAIRWQKLGGMESQQVFGIENEPTTVQVPTHIVKTAFASEELAETETLLIDPFFKRSYVVQRETGVPILNSIPYVGRRFKNVAVAKGDHNIMVLLQPKIQ